MHNNKKNKHKIYRNKSFIKINDKNLTNQYKFGDLRMKKQLNYFGIIIKRIIYIKR